MLERYGQNVSSLNDFWCTPRPAMPGFVEIRLVFWKMKHADGHTMHMNKHQTHCMVVIRGRKCGLRLNFESVHKGEVASVPKHHTMRAYRGSGNKAPRILDYHFTGERVCPGFILIIAMFVTNVVNVNTQPY